MHTRGKATLVFFCTFFWSLTFARLALIEPTPCKAEDKHKADDEFRQSKFESDVFRDAFSEMSDASSFLQLSKTSKRADTLQAPWEPCFDYAKRAKEQKTTLTIVRTHNPSPGIVHRVAKFAEDLHAHPSVSLMLMTSQDDTGLVAPWTQEIDKKVKDIPNTMFHQIDRQHVVNEYPVWREMRKFNNRLAKEWRPSGWDTHTEYILLAAEQVRRSGKLHDDGYVWVFEDDVGICGNMSEFIAGYSDDPTDFIATRDLERASETWRQPWMHYSEGSEGFLNTYPISNRWRAFEMVERFSVRFLLHLDDLIRNKSISAHSEMFPATVCMNSKEFTCSTIKEKDFFEGKDFDDVSRVTREQWEEMCPSNQKCHSPPWIAHALKW